MVLCHHSLRSQTKNLYLQLGSLLIVVDINSYCKLSSRSYMNFGDHFLFRPSWIITVFASLVAVRADARE